MASGQLTATHDPQHAVRKRLKTVLRRARRVAECPRDAEAVHGLRTATRRAAAAIDAFEPHLASDPARNAKKLLRRLRRAAASARDLDVQATLWQHLADEHPRAAPAALAMRTRTLDQRSDASKSVRRAATDKRVERLRHLAKKLARPRSSQADPDAFATERLSSFGRQLLAQINQNPTTDPQIHRARIAAKRFRYAFEIFRDRLEPAQRKALARDLALLHDTLGEHQDLVVARSHLDTARRLEATDASVAALKAEVDRRIDGGRTAAISALNRFANTWLRSGLDHASATRPATQSSNNSANAQSDTTPPAPREIERKFLVTAAPPGPHACNPRTISQGYLAVDANGTEVRVRRTDGRPTLTVKRGAGMTRDEIELPLDAASAQALWPLTEGRRIEKSRQTIQLGERNPPIQTTLDVYTGALDGLRVAEIEFTTEAEAHAFAPPDWLGQEITQDTRYRNSALASAPAPPEPRLTPPPAAR